VITWSRNPHAKTPIPGKPSKSGLIGVWHNDVNLVITWSHNPHAKTPIPGKPSKSGLIGVWHNDVNLVITWSRNPHTKTLIPENPSKSSLIGVWHKDNLYLSTSTIGNRDPHPTNIDSRTRSIRMTSRRQLFFDKSFFSSLENHGREIISPTHTHKVRQTKSFINLNCLMTRPKDVFSQVQECRSNK